MDGLGSHHWMIKRKCVESSGFIVKALVIWEYSIVALVDVILTEWNMKEKNKKFELVLCNRNKNGKKIVGKKRLYQGGNASAVAVVYNRNKSGNE